MPDFLREGFLNANKEDVNTAKIRKKSLILEIPDTGYLIQLTSIKHPVSRIQYQESFKKEISNILCMKLNFSL